MELLFPVFLEDESSYKQAVAFWQELFDTLLAETNLAYTSYLNTTTVKGISLRDGNPIFDAYFPDLNKTIRIIQEEPEADNVLEIGAWLQQTEIENDHTTPELIIALVLAKETLPLAKKLIVKWILENKDIAEMQKIINEVIL